MKESLAHYQTWIFDCDGVLLDSNPAKANAFYTAALPYGEDVARDIRTYHMNNGGISRFKKFRHVFENILGRSNYESDYERMVNDFSVASRAELRRCMPVSGIRDFLQSAPKDTRMFVISGAEQEELRWCLEVHDLAKYFHGIFGSPKTKPEILAELNASGSLIEPAIYFGDSRYDYVSATGAGCDFVFVHGFTDFANWEAFVRENGISAVRDFLDPDLVSNSHCKK